MKRKPTSVYFFRPVGMDGPIKIGCSAEPEKRLATYSPMSPYALEMIGTFPGSSRDENYLHRAFASAHSHREWFHSTPLLRRVIALVIEAQSIEPAKDLLKKRGAIRKSTVVVRSPAHMRFLKLKKAVREAQRALRSADEYGSWQTPHDVGKIISRWGAQVYNGTGFAPTNAEFERVQQYLADPKAHSVIPHWRTAQTLQPASAA